MSASPLLSKYCKPEDGSAAQNISPEKAGWQYVGFEVQELQAGDTISQATEDQEYCLVLVSGLASLTSKTLK